MSEKEAMKTTVAKHLVELMKRQGIGHVFGIPSGDWLPYMEAMEEGGIRFVLVANEASAGFMATVYSRLRNVPGVCYGTFGPGATNLTTGVGCAFLDRAPVIALTSEAPDDMIGRTLQMAVDQQALMLPLTKWTTRLSPANIDRVFTRAVRVATSEYPGPVHIGLPGGVGDLLCSATKSDPVAPSIPSSPDEASLNRMEEVFARSERPVLAAGLTALRLGLGSRITAVAERHGIPVVLTPMAKGILNENHPSYAGVLMHALSDRVAKTYGKADLVLGVGYDPVEFNYEEWMPEVPLVHVDCEPADIDTRTYPSVLNVLGNPVEALDRLAALEPVNSTWDLGGIEREKERMFASMVPGDTQFGPLAILSGLRDILPEDGIMTCDVGSHTHLIGQMWKTPHPHGQIMTNGWSSMGFGVPAAIAAKIACPDKQVVCVTGDGGFMMMAGEMATAARLGLPIVFIVLADRALGLIRIKQGRRGTVTDDTLLSGNNVPSSGYVFGVPVISVRDENSYTEGLKSALESGGPVIIEAVIQKSEYDDLILRKHK